VGRIGKKPHFADDVAVQLADCRSKQWKSNETD